MHVICTITLERIKKMFKKRNLQAILSLPKFKPRKTVTTTSSLLLPPPCEIQEFMSADCWWKNQWEQVLSGVYACNTILCLKNIIFIFILNCTYNIFSISNKEIIWIVALRNKNLFLLSIRLAISLFFVIEFIIISYCFISLHE